MAKQKVKVEKESSKSFNFYEESFSRAGSSSMGRHARAFKQYPESRGWEVTLYRPGGGAAGGEARISRQRAFKLAKMWVEGGSGQ